MRNIYISDNSIRHTGDSSGVPMSFRLKIEIAKRLDALGVSVIETATIKDCRTDYLLVKSVASAVTSASVTVPVDILNPDSIALSWDALKDAVHPRLQVPVPASTVQMEYFCHKKPDAVIDLISERVASCSALCGDVEFVALDFTRSESAFLEKAMKAAVDAGANVVTVSDLAGNLLPDEFCRSVRHIREILPEGVRLGVQCSNELYLADACAVAAVRAGADEVKTSVFGRYSASLERFCRILDTRSDILGASCPVRMTELERATSEILEMCEAYRSNPRAVSGMTEGETEQDNSEDEPVPETYRLESYLINSGNIISSTCHLRLRKADRLLESVCVGNGPVDASFQAVEKVVGERYELDDFKIRSVTEGREAMGETVIQLRHMGKIYQGRGISTDIVGSSILAYIDAANKIAYEEETV